MDNKRWAIILFIIFIIVSFPLFKIWYIFSLDQVLNPNWWTPKVWDHIYWVWLLSQIFVFFHIPVWILEKIIIILTLWLPLLSWYLFFKDTKNIYVVLFASFLLLFNPFLYGRFIDGQINIYLSFSLFTLFFYFLKNIFEKFNLKDLAILSWLSLLLCLTSIHNAVFLFFIFLIFWIVYIKKTWIKNISKIFIWVWIINLFWIIPFFFSSQNDKFELIKQIKDFWIEQQQAFSTLKDENIYFNILSMNWYWWEWEKRFITNKEINEKWKNLFLLLFIIVLLWIFYRLFINKENNTFEKWLIILWVISFILALWNSNNNIFTNISNLLYQYFPFYKWFREPQKWVMFLVMIYAYFWAYWVKYINECLWKYKINSFSKKSILWVLILIPIFYTPKILFWFTWQISIQNYPIEWQEIKNITYSNNSLNCEYLSKNISTKCYDTLVFPRHSYMWIKWVWKIVWGWIVMYFWDNVLFWDNLEIRNIYSSSSRPESKIIEKYIGPSGVFKWDYNNHMIHFINDLKWLWINRIILLKEADYKLYDEILLKLEKNKLIELEKSNSMVKLFKIIK